MEIVAFEGDKELEWWFEWSTENEMSCRQGSQGNFTTYTWKK
jgi:hypothetical protein